jgi:V/A-type H+-transporting ATPase subunit C
MEYLHAHSISSHDVRYAFASGRVRALETRLIGRQRMDRLAEAKDIAETLRLLSDTVYGEHLDEIEEIGYETFLRHEEARVLDLVDSLSLDPPLGDVLRLEYDFNNLKVLLRESFSGRDLSRLYMDLGKYPVEEIKDALASETPGRMPEPLAEAAARGKEAWDGTSDPAEVDTAVDGVMFAHFLKVAGHHNVPYLEELTRVKIDLANIRTFLRARYIELEPKGFGRLLYPGGNVKTEIFTETFQLPIEEVLSRFQFSPYRPVIEKGASAVEREDSFVPLEREIDSYVVSFLRLSKYFTFGFEIVMTYALIKKSEIMALRLILASKEKDMPTESIKERIPDAF